jgi:hypothetical protein
MEKNYLILNRASASRPSGEWNDDDFDVLANGAVVGRIFRANAAPVGTPWMWTLAFGLGLDRLGRAETRHQPPGGPPPDDSRMLRQFRKIARELFSKEFEWNHFTKLFSPHVATYPLGRLHRAYQNR